MACTMRRMDRYYVCTVNLLHDVIIIIRGTLTSLSCSGSVEYKFTTARIQIHLRTRNTITFTNQHTLSPHPQTCAYRDV